MIYFYPKRQLINHAINLNYSEILNCIIPDYFHLHSYWFCSFEKWATGGNRSIDPVLLNHYSLLEVWHLFFKLVQTFFEERSSFDLVVGDFLSLGSEINHNEWFNFNCLVIVDTPPIFFSNNFQPTRTDSSLGTTYQFDLLPETWLCLPFISSFEFTHPKHGTRDNPI